MPRKKKDAPIEESITVQDAHVFDYIKDNHTVEGVEFHVKPYLNPGDQMKFCNHIVDTVFTEAGYTPALFDFAEKYATIVCYTDIEIPAREGILNELSDVIYGSDLIAFIDDNIKLDQQFYLSTAASDQIANRNALIASYSAADDMYASINSILDNVNTWLDKNLKKLTLDKKTIARLRDVMSKFANVSDADIAKEIVNHVKTTEKDNVVEFLTEKN